MQERLRSLQQTEELSTLDLDTLKKEEEYHGFVMQLFLSKMNADMGNIDREAGKEPSLLLDRMSSRRRTCEQ